jgi:(p)ppGpp synthase/HD superfamily hydrolase
MTDFYSNTFIDALQYAASLHRTQSRKGTDIPYVSHLMSVAGIIMEAGGDETLTIAGLLHDAVEDQGGLPTLAQIQLKFGDEVARIVEACSDAAPVSHQEKAPWLQRKNEHLTKLRSEDEAVLLVTTCDKIHNGESILHDLQTYGVDVWSRFNASPHEITWYYTSVLEIAQDRLNNNYAVGRLRRAATALSEAANT